MSEKKSKELPGTGKGSEVWAALSYTLNTPSCISNSKEATGWGCHSKGSPLMREGAAASCMLGCCSSGDTSGANSHLSLYATHSSNHSLNHSLVHSLAFYETTKSVGVDLDEQTSPTATLSKRIKARIVYECAAAHLPSG